MLHDCLFETFNGNRNPQIDLKLRVEDGKKTFCTTKKWGMYASKNYTNKVPAEYVLSDQESLDERIGGEAHFGCKTLSDKVYQKALKWF